MVQSSILPTIDEETMNGLMTVAIDASKKAGRIIRQHSNGTGIKQTKSNPRDLLTLIDSLCEQTIREVVVEAYPHHSFLGEESVPPGKEASAAAIKRILSDTDQTADFIWIVDPIDGTTNFVHGMPISVPSIAVAHRGEVVVGVIFDPHRDQIYTAMKGGGAYLNGKKISVGMQDHLSESIIAMGSPPAEDSMQFSLNGLGILLFSVRAVRMLGSAALMMAWVASGKLTCYWEYDLSCWDVCAGVLLVQEAGGQVTDFDGKEFSLETRKICASNRRIHQDILHALNEAGIK